MVVELVKSGIPTVTIGHVFDDVSAIVSNDVQGMPQAMLDISSMRVKMVFSMISSYLNRSAMIFSLILEAKELYTITMAKTLTIRKTDTAYKVIDQTNRDFVMLFTGQSRAVTLYNIQLLAPKRDCPDRTKRTHKRLFLFSFLSNNMGALLQR